LFTFTVATGIITAVTKTDRQGYITSITPFTPTVFDYTFSFRVYASYFGYTAFRDGNWTVTYTITNINPTVYSTTTGGSSFFLSQARCAIDNLMAKYASKANGTGYEDYKKIINGDVYLRGARVSSDCGKINAANNALRMVWDIIGLDRYEHKNECGC
jgi:hypothetical protein